MAKVNCCTFVVGAKLHEFRTMNKIEKPTVDYRKSGLMLFLLMPTIAFAAAGLSDAHYSHRQWIFPAYLYCFILGFISLVVMAVTSVIWKSKMQSITTKVASRLISHNICAIIVTGILLAIPIGIIGNVLWECLWFLSFPAVIIGMIAFPLIIVITPLRNKWLLSGSVLKWLLMISVSIVMASILFIILTKCNLLHNTETAYLISRERYNYYIKTHPFDSLMEIWETPLLLSTEIIIALILYGCWIGIRSLFQRLF